MTREELLRELLLLTAITEGVEQGLLVDWCPECNAPAHPCAEHASDDE